MQTSTNTATLFKDLQFFWVACCTLTALELRDPGKKDEDVALEPFKLNFSLLISSSACISASLASNIPTFLRVDNRSPPPRQWLVSKWIPSMKNESYLFADLYARSLVRNPREFFESIHYWLNFCQLLAAWLAASAVGGGTFSMIHL